MLCGGHIMWSAIQRAWHWFGQYTRAQALAEILGWRERLAGILVLATGWIYSWRLPWLILGSCATACSTAAGS